MKTWTIDDQQKFAAISGDFNPIHVDPLEARRSIFGKPIVHGIHLVLWALDEYCSLIENKLRLKKLRAVFRRPVGPNEEVSLAINVNDDFKGDLSVESEGIQRAFMAVEFFRGDFKTGIPAGFQNIFKIRAPKTLSLEELQRAEGTLEMRADINALQRLFPSLCNQMPAEQIVLLTTSTRLVGMECPGRYSIYNELFLNFYFCHSRESGNPICDNFAAAPNQLHYKVEEYNESIKLCQIRLESSVAQGHIKAFVRPSLIERYDLDHMKKCVIAGEFAGQKALVIGGSRGLGAVTAKILALGSADVCITFNQGQQEATEISEELKTQGYFLRTVKFDILDHDKNIKEVLDIDWSPTHLYYFATPFIFEGSPKRFSESLFDRFCRFYVSGFWRVFSSLIPSQSLKFILYPSSSALDQLPAGMFEYTAAKAAGESMCDFIRKNYPGISVVCPRLGRLATDQTVSIIPVENKDPVPVLLELLRKNDSKNKGGQ